MGCWTCQPFCEHCKPKFYDCPACGGQGSIYFKKCLDCGRAMTPEDAKSGRDAWFKKQQKKIERASTPSDPSSPQQ